MPGQRTKKWENVGIDTYLLEQIEELIEKSIFPSKQQAVNYMVRKYLESYKSIEELERENKRLSKELAKFQI